MRIFSIMGVCSLLTLLLTAQTHAKSPPPGAGIADIPANILLALDTSGSMSSVVDTIGSFSYPYDITTDSRGYTYVAEIYAGVAVFDTAGEHVRDIGRFDSSSSQPDNFYYIYGVATDSDDNVYVCDRYHNRVQVFDKDGDFLRSLSLNYGCKGIEISPSDQIYVLGNNSYLSVFNKNGSSASPWYKSNVIHIGFDKDGRIYAIRKISGNYRLHFYNANHSYVNFFYLSSSNIGYNIEYPTFVAVDDDYNIYISDSDYYDSSVFKIHKRSDRTVINDTGDIDYTAYRGGYRSSAEGFYRSPYGLHYDKNSGDVLIADYYNDRIQAYNAGATVIEGRGETRLEQMVKVIKQIVSDSTLNDGAHFGLMEWNNDAEITVPISEDGASDIFTRVDSLTAAGGTYLAEAMDEASDYFLGTSEDNPRDASISCQKNVVIVISDGFWVKNNSEDIARDLSDNHDILTHLIGFQTTGDNNYVTMAQAGGTYPESPLFADNWQELYERLSTVIRNAINADLTFAAPTIMPDVVGDDHILQATFRYKSEHQWKGRLKKFALDNSGEVKSMVWDAGDQLNAISADNRNIWTVANNLTPGLNNFTTANRNGLRPLMEAHRNSPFDNADLDDLIEFVRGKDVYAEYPDGTDDEGDTLYSGDRWKLADIYHSRALAAGPPSARIAKEANGFSDAYYRSQNNYATFKSSYDCGAQCLQRRSVVYAGSNGGMLHAFDADTGDEMWGFIPPMLLPRFKDMISSTAGSSAAIFGVDGSPTIKDVFDGQKWRTVLAIGLRQGGGGYSFLDVTNPYAPEHLFSIGYDTTTEEVRYWDADGVEAVFPRRNAIPEGFDVSRLGETWSEPVILRLPIGPGNSDKWVVVAGGGYNNRVNSDYGDTVYFFDLFGEEPVLKALQLADRSATGKIANSVPAKISAITVDTTARFPYAGALLYVTDQEGILHKINVSSQDINYVTEDIMDAVSRSGNGRVNFSHTVAAFSDGNLYHVTGTGDITALDNIGDRVDNRIFAVRDRFFPDIVPGTAPLKFSDLPNKTDDDASCELAEDNGWEIRMNNTGKVLSAATVFNHEVLAPIYYPETDNICQGGSSSLMEIRFECGTEIRETPLGYGISTRAVVYNNRIYLGISDSGTTVPLPDGFVKSGNLIVGTPVNKRATSVTVESWWEGD